MDTKSASIIGICIIIAALIIALVPRKGGGTGRFQLGGIPGHVYVLDTETGRVWAKSAPLDQMVITSGFDQVKPR